MNIKTVPTALAFAVVSLMLTGCGGSKSLPNVTSQPLDNDLDNGNGTTPTPTPTPTPYTYDKSKFDVVDIAKGNNKIAIGVADTGVQKNTYLQDSVEKVLKYINDYQAGTFRVEDLTTAGISLQDVSPSLHGTLVAQIIAGKIPDQSNFMEKAMTEGLAKDISQIYGIQSADRELGYATTAGHLQAMNDLNKKYAVKLFNASFATMFASGDYKQRLLDYTAELVKGDALVVFATGNDGFANPSVESLLPAGNEAVEKGVISVTGLDETGQKLFRNADGKGANACGDSARWCLAADFRFGPLYSNKLQGLVYFSGTSAAAPQVTTTAALVWSKYPWLNADQVRQVLLTNADYLDDGSEENKLYNSTTGWGRLDLEGSLKGIRLFSKEFGDNFDANVIGTSVFSNNIGGDAGLTKKGNGILVLSGANTYQGSTSVENGKLRVTGSITSPVSVTKAGVLSGNGTVGSVVNSGKVTTADGRLTVNGNYTQNASGILNYNLHHYLTIKGNAALAGSLDVSAASRNILTKGEHTVLTANKVTGTFEQYKSVSPFLAVSGLEHHANKVTVDVDYANAVAAGTVSSGISVVSGKLLNDLMDKANTQALNGQVTDLTKYVGTIQSVQSREAAQAILNSNSGAVFVETPSVLLRNDSLVNAQIAQRSHQLLYAGQGGVWANASYLNNQNSANGWDDVESHVSVLSVGADTMVRDDLAVGAYISEYQDKSDFEQTKASADADVTNLGAYLKWQAADNLYVAGNMQFGWGDVEFKRVLTDAVASVDSRSKADLSKYGVYGEIGYDYFTEQLSVSPYLALSYNTVDLDGVKEVNVLGVAVSDVSIAETKAHVGVRLDYQLTPNVVLTGYGEYANAFSRDYDKVALSMNVDSTRNVLFTPPSFDKDYLLYGIGFNYQSGQNWNIFGDVNGNALDSGDYQLQLGLKYGF